MKKVKIKIEQIKKEISTAEQALLIKHHKKIRKNLKKHIDNQRKLASFINKSN